MKIKPAQGRIALFGNFGTGNLGNEATLQAMVYNVRRHLPTSDLWCVCPAPEKTALDLGIPAVSIRARWPLWKLTPRNDQANNTAAVTREATLLGFRRWFSVLARLRVPLRLCALPLLETYRWLRVVAMLRQSDCLIMTGTGMVGDFAIKPLGLHYDIFRWAVVSKLCGCKLLFVSVGSGPIPHPLSRFFVKTALRFADYRSYRDSCSKDFLAAMGLDVNDDVVCPDLAFSLPLISAIPKIDLCPAEKRLVIGVGLLNYHHRRGGPGRDMSIYSAYLDAIASLVIRLIQNKYVVRIVVGDVVWDEDVRRDLKRLLEKKGADYANGSILDEQISSVDGLVAQLSSIDIMIASRYHNALLTLMLARPVIALSYHEKFQPLMDGVGLGEFCFDIEKIDINKIMEGITQLSGSLEFQNQVARATKSYRVALERQYETILQTLESEMLYSVESRDV